MLTVERREVAADRRDGALVPVVIALLHAYAGLSLSVAGFVLDNATMIVGGMVLVGSSSIVIKLKAKASVRREVKSASHIIHRGCP